VNHINAEEAMGSPSVVMGMFPVNSVIATVLFDSGASHSFASKRFVEKNHLACFPMEKLMLVQSPGSELEAKFFCKDVSILIRGLNS
jgi:hypothetical protein